MKSPLPLSFPQPSGSHTDGLNNLCLFGAAPDTGNLGVSALCYAILFGLHRAAPNALVTVFDHTRGLRAETLSSETSHIRFSRRGASHSRRYYRRDTLWNMRISGWLGGLGNSNLRLVRTCDAVLDISGGDSFTDLYGHWRFRAVTLPKLIAIEQRIPLILLPQTYGPFESNVTKETARRILRGATAAWARDKRSFAVLRELLGEQFDPTYHRCGVDVAFALPTILPNTLPQRAAAWLTDKLRPMAGLNVSGLVYNDPARAAAFGIRADYRELVLSIARRLLRESDCRLLLIPHVVTEPGHFESDVDACKDLLGRLGALATDRVIVIPSLPHPSEIKWVIAQLDWFCGTRMHSTIAGLSSGVPTAAIAYSDKTQGVFDTCNQGMNVFDPRRDMIDDIVDGLWASYNSRKSTAASLAVDLPGIAAQAADQLTDIVGQIQFARTLRAT